MVDFFGYKQGVDMFGKRIGFLKFIAEIIDKETGNKVSYDLHNMFSLLVYWGIFMS